jgi:diguanylate cyclase (GGDEF)-like protein
MVGLNIPVNFSAALEDAHSANDPVDAETKVRRLQDEISILKTQLLQLEQKADADPLIPIYNRRALMREIGRAQVLMSRYDILCSVVFFDLNGFKKVNDRFGHSIGDDLLIKIGKALKATVRDCDMVARVGGDEFAVLLFKTDIAEAKAKAASLACRIAEQSIDMAGELVSVNTAWGVSPCFPDDTPKQILHRADRAMYEAKADPR